jgi:hypothetical protein
MDDQRFDSLTKGLARGRTRRDVLKIFAGGAAGGVLAMRALGEASAQCAGDGALCGGMYADCCSGFVCSNSYCVAEAPAQEPEPATTTDTSTTTTTTMPATGSGPASTDTTPWLGVALAGGAAAWLAGRELRKDAPAEE